MASSTQAAPTFRESALYGGGGGKAFSDISHIPVDITRWPLRKINIRHGSRIDNIQLVYDGQTGTAYGGSGGGAETFELKAGELITQINVWSGSEVDALQFITNQGTTSKKYGGSGGGKHEVKASGGSLAYIKGRSGSRLDAIGLVFQVESKGRDIYTTSDAFGGGGGSPFSDLLLLPSQIDANPVQRVRVRHGSRLDSIQFEYKGMGALSKHGGNGGSESVFELDSANEFIATVKLRSGSEVDGIQFITSAGRTSAWYGGKGGDEHTVTGTIAGIFGRAGSRIDQIGFLLAPAPNYLFTNFEYKMPDLKVTALKTITATNYSDTEQSATTSYSYTDTHSETITAEWGVQVGYKMTIKENFVFGEVTQELSITATVNNSKAVTNEESTNITENATIVVPPKSTMKGSVLVKRASGQEIDMTCDKYLIFPDGTQQFLGKISGKFTFDIMGDTYVEWGAATPVTVSGTGVATTVT